MFESSRTRHWTVLVPRQEAGALWFTANSLKSPKADLIFLVHALILFYTSDSWFSAQEKLLLRWLFQEIYLKVAHLSGQEAKKSPLLAQWQGIVFRIILQCRMYKGAPEGAFFTNPYSLVAIKTLWLLNCANTNEQRSYQVIPLWSCYRPNESRVYTNHRWEHLLIPASGDCDELSLTTVRILKQTWQRIYKTKNCVLLYTPLHKFKLFLLEFSHKKKLYGCWKKGQETWKDCRDAIHLCREKIFVAKAQLELKLARSVGDNKKSFLKYMNKKKKDQRKHRSASWWGRSPHRQGHRQSRDV